MVQLCMDRTNKTTEYFYYDIEGKSLNFGRSQSSAMLDMPKNVLSEILEVCEKIAVFFPYVRIDFFVDGERPQITELTFTPSAGLKPDISGDRGDIEMGKMLDIKEM